MSTKTRVAILGATGYTAVEAIQLLLRHPHVEVTAVTSREPGRRLTQVHPALTGRLDLVFEEYTTPEKLAEKADVVFGCLPHGASASVIPGLLNAGCKVIDFSADYRLNDPAVFARWYGSESHDPTRLGHVPYGLPELFRPSIVGAQLVANPGCYPQTVVLPLAPLLKAGLIEPTSIIADAKSGVSGAGRNPKLNNLYPECNESISAYGVGTHRHTPEIDQVLSIMGGTATEVIFTPHLTPMDRGILTTTYSVPTRQVTQAELYECVREFYKNEPFIHVVDDLPATKHVAHTNFCNMALRVVRGRVMTIAAIDNLIKGASGSAVQNMNIIRGFPETTALL
ncbi:MAG: N-acetyl-gamma-glutamyl-phosphate reductase [Thermoguttaceae bacterium]|nr:N-acetyl-gamma-glutamyl-phosphate reductase [Thermoguttaceae bacterium]